MENVKYKQFLFDYLWRKGCKVSPMQEDEDPPTGRGDRALRAAAFLF